MPLRDEPGNHKGCPYRYCTEPERHLDVLPRLIIEFVRDLDPVTLVAAPALLAVTATCACLVPTLRATRGEPAGVLRGE